MQGQERGQESGQEQSQPGCVKQQLETCKVFRAAVFFFTPLSPSLLLEQSSVHRYPEQRAQVPGCIPILTEREAKRCSSVQSTFKQSLKREGREFKVVLLN